MKFQSVLGPLKRRRNIFKYATNEIIVRSRAKKLLFIKHLFFVFFFNKICFLLRRNYKNGKQNQTKKLIKKYLSFFDGKINKFYCNLQMRNRYKTANTIDNNSFKYQKLKFPIKFFKKKKHNERLHCNISIDCRIFCGQC